ncbi:protein FAM161A isoform X4 [Hemicordylus capensis]|nr:protein FAM161A isoform X4 [Hemicordylus capensis]
MYLSNQEYYLKLEELKNAHLETMAKLENMYRNKLYLKDVQPITNVDNCSMSYRSTWEKSSFHPQNIRKSFSEPELNNSFHSNSSDVSDQELELENVSEGGGSLIGKEQIDNVWDELSLENYSHRTKSIASKLQSLKKSKRKKKNWSPMVTVPEPFQMTIREAKKKKQNIKSKSLIELENSFLKKQLEEEAECQKKFRANPVPAYVFVPLYHEIMQQNEERRKSIRERRREILLASQKPFQFIEREAQKKEMRKMQLRDLSEPEKKKVFKAKPVPKFVYSSEVNEKLKEEELYREIRIRVRSEELLRNSSLPNSRLGNRGADKHRQQDCLEQSEELEHKPRTKLKIPDFEKLHQKFQKQLQKQKNVKNITVCEPFKLHTRTIPSKKERILEDIQMDEERLKETRWPYASSRCKPEMRSLNTNSYPLGCEESTFPKITKSTRRRLKALRKHEKQRMKEYLQELEEMEERVEKRPLLLERATQKNARIAAEKHYSDTLRELGLCEEFVSKKGQTATEMLLRYCSSDGSEHSVADTGSDDENKVDARESRGEEKSGLQSEDEDEDEKEAVVAAVAEAQSYHDDQDALDYENENYEEDSEEKSTDDEG